MSHVVTQDILVSHLEKFEYRMTANLSAFVAKAIQESEERVTEKITKTIIKYVDKKIDEKIDQLAIAVGKGFAGVDEQFKVVNRRLDRLERILLPV